MWHLHHPSKLPIILGELLGDAILMNTVLAGFLIIYVLPFWFLEFFCLNGILPCAAKAIPSRMRIKENLPAMQETWVWFLGWEDPLVKEMATHSSIIAWKSPWTEEPGELQPMGSQRVRHDWATNTTTTVYFPTSYPWVLDCGDATNKKNKTEQIIAHLECVFSWKCSGKK